MTAEIVNLRRFRKAKERAAKEAEAGANRVLHGRTKAERTAGNADRERERRRLDGLQLAPAEPPSPAHATTGESAGSDEPAGHGLDPGSVS